MQVFIAVCEERGFVANRWSSIGKPMRDLHDGAALLRRHAFDK